MSLSLVLSESLVVVDRPGEPQAGTVPATLAKPVMLTEGDGFAFYKQGRGPKGEAVEHLITVVVTETPDLVAHTAEQRAAWAGQVLVARPVRLMRR